MLRRYALPSPYLTQEAVEWLMGKITNEAEQVCDGFEVVWDGNNHVGRLTEDAHLIFYICSIAVTINMLPKIWLKGR